MGRRWLTRKGNYILKSKLPIGVQNMTLKSTDNDERPTGKKHANVGWDDGGKICKIIN